MKIALLNENSQAAKNSIIYSCLKDVCDSKGFTLYNYGMSDENDSNLTYVQLGLLSAILLNSGAVDFVVTGCGTGQGAMLALNSFPNVLCGLVNDPLEAYLFAQINDGNAISIPYAKGFGWGSELNLKNIFNSLFSEPFGGGYPVERKEPEQRNKKILDSVKVVTHNDITTILKNIDLDFLRSTIDNKYFKDNFFKNSKNEEISSYLKKVLESVCCE